MSIEKITNHTDQAKGRLPDRFALATQFRNLIDLMGGRTQELENMLFNLFEQRAISTATGKQLDKAGEILNLPRELGESDSAYRSRLYSATGQLEKSGEVESVIDIYDFLISPDMVMYKELYPAGFSLTALTDIDAEDRDEDRYNTEAMKAVKAGGVDMELIISPFTDSFELSDESETDINDDSPIDESHGLGRDQNTSNVYADDYTVGDNRGTLYGDTTWSTDGPTSSITGSAVFDGAGDYIDIGDISELTFGTSDFSVGFWVKPNSVSGLRGLISKRGTGAAGTNPGWGIRQSNANLYLEFDDGTANSIVNTIAGVALTTNTWSYIEFTFDRSGYCTVYVDGAYFNQVDISAIGDISGSQPLQFGSTPTYAYDFQGNLSDVRIWNYVRPQSEIQADMNTRLTGNETGLVGYWPLDDGAFDDGGKIGRSIINPYSITNILKYSEQFDQPNWTKIGSMNIVPNNAVAPDGSLTAYRIDANDAANFEQINQYVSSVYIDGAAYCASVFVKKDDIDASVRFPFLRIAFSTGGLVDIRFNTKTGFFDIGNQTTTLIGYDLEDYGDYWRAWVSAVASGGLNVSMTIFPAGGTYSGGFNYSNTAQGSCHIWGAQIRMGVLPGDYAKTLDQPNTKWFGL